MSSPEVFPSQNVTANNSNQSKNGTDLFFNHLNNLLGLLYDSAFMFHNVPKSVLSVKAVCKYIRSSFNSKAPFFCVPHALKVSIKESDVKSNKWLKAHYCRCKSSAVFLESESESTLLAKFVYACSEFNS